MTLYAGPSWYRTRPGGYFAKRFQKSEQVFCLFVFFYRLVLGDHSKAALSLKQKTNC